jgi:hypothetical protein
MSRDLFRCESARDEPQDLYLTIGEREAGTRAPQQDAARHGPADEGTHSEQRRSADIH